MKAILQRNSDTVYFMCPGCEMVHGVPIEGEKAWGWNGNMEAPSFTPSILCTWPPTSKRCHSYVTDGKIKFEADCSHKLANSTADLTPWDFGEDFKG